MLLSALDDSYMLVACTGLSVVACPFGFVWLPETKRMPLPDILPDTSEVGGLITRELSGFRSKMI